MSQTNRTPAGPERGSVATGQQTPQRNGEGDSGNGRVVDAAVEPATEGADTARAEELGGHGRGHVASGAPASDGDEPRTPDATATAKFRVAPEPRSGDAARARNRRPGANRRPDTDPAPAVPMPGPAAARPAVAPHAGSRDPGGPARLGRGRPARRRPHRLPRAAPVHGAARQGPQAGRRRARAAVPWQPHPATAAGRAAAQAARPVVGAQAGPRARGRAVPHLAGGGRRALRGARRHRRLGSAQRHVRRSGVRRGPAAVR